MILQNIATGNYFPNIFERFVFNLEINVPLSIASFIFVNVFHNVFCIPTKLYPGEQRCSRLVALAALVSSLAVGENSA